MGHIRPEVYLLPPPSPPIQLAVSYSTHSEHTQNYMLIVRFTIPEKPFQVSWGPLVLSAYSPSSFSFAFFFYFLLDHPALKVERKPPIVHQNLITVEPLNNGGKAKWPLFGGGR